MSDVLGNIAGRTEQIGDGVVSARALGLPFIHNADIQSTIFLYDKVVMMLHKSVVTQ
jgi:hypothetical protein